MARNDYHTPQLNDVLTPGGHLNPQWAAWFMGFPVDWLDGVEPPSRRSATPSSRKSRKASAAESSTP
jgi:hypothetical protein